MPTQIDKALTEPSRWYVDGSVRHSSTGEVRASDAAEVLRLGSCSHRYGGAKGARGASPTATTATAVTKKAATLTKQANAVARIIASGLLEDGTELTGPNARHNDARRTAIDDWVVELPARRRATWRNDTSGPIVWEVDGGSLRLQFGAQYAETKQGRYSFRKDFDRNTGLVAAVYPAARFDLRDSGLVLYKSPPSVPKVRSPLRER